METSKRPRNLLPRLLTVFMLAACLGIATAPGCSDGGGNGNGGEVTCTPDVEYCLNVIAVCKYWDEYGCQNFFGGDVESIQQCVDKALTESLDSGCGDTYWACMLSCIAESRDCDSDEECCREYDDCTGMNDPDPDIDWDCYGNYCDW